jgi:shikimate kinase
VFTKFRHIVLLGLMGVGKTTVGLALAERLQLPLDDSDASISARCGATVRELSERVGVTGMHRLEAEHLLGALDGPGPRIICAAASVVDRPECVRALLAPDVFAAWLQAQPETLVARFAGGPHRPVLDIDTERLFRRQLAVRSEGFAAVADVCVDVEGRAPSAVAEEIAGAFERC